MSDQITVHLRIHADDADGRCVDLSKRFDDFHPDATLQQVTDRLEALAARLTGIDMEVGESWAEITLNPAPGEDDPS